MRRGAVLAPILLASCADDVAPAGTGGAGGETYATASSAATAPSSGGGAPSSAASSGSGGAEPRCGDGAVDEGEACDDGNDGRFDGCLPDCTAVPPLDTPPLEWTYVEVPGTTCMNGAVGGFGVSLSPGSDRVMIYLEGGGACFNDACDFTAFSIPFVPPPDGIFDRTAANNPVRDWSMVYVPYCTGDIHGGDAEAVLGGLPRSFRGYGNITKYLEQWVPTFREASHVLLTGISAGGFGAGLNFPQVADAFGAGPQMILVDDSGPPLGSDAIAPCLQQIFRDVWGLDETILAHCGADCPDPNDFAAGFLGHLAERYPTARVGLFSNTADLVIRTFMGFGWCDGQHDDCEGTATIVPADVYEGALLDLRATYGSRAATYYVGQIHPQYNYGRNHTVLRGPAYQTTILEGVSVPTWLGGVIEGQVQHVGP
jgi:cysteine-rich repeat protein